MELLIKKETLMEFLKIEGMTALDLYNVWNEKYNFDISYKTFNKLINNKIVWKLSYGIALVEMFRVDVTDLFEWK